VEDEEVTALDQDGQDLQRHASGVVTEIEDADR